MTQAAEALIALEDGRLFPGRSFGAPGTRCGEVVFNTSMTGYQEILTDPSYAGQIVTMTYPQIGNYGVNPDDVESGRIQVEGLVVKEACRIPSNWRSRQSLPDYLAAQGVIGIEGVDTRALTLHIRTAGAMKAAISTEGRSVEELVAMARAWPGLVGRDMVERVTCHEAYGWGAASVECGVRSAERQSEIASPRFHVVAYDFGAKHNILRLLAASGCRITVVPAYTPAAEALALRPDGILLSNGPGDPAALTRIIPEVQRLVGKAPIFGICLGHQLLGLALGGRTFKLKFGHRGANQPVRELATGRVDITSQNHGFCVDIDSMPQDEVELTHVNLDDGTLEGFRHRRLPLFAVQYHPEASPGPHDASHLFKRFVDLMEKETTSRKLQTTSQPP
ncbi:MAG TPA: glutamine-hydrolyzing carbamoyl-phosphate synthase small subunit [Planctomycetota bacterium]|nr:glutamine-hydrolyzing carbamoyl-phosphate synthase small subunit [Planctomycetota bacterium]HRR82938.1 glutamine-hydrolyzing carbamoyl-phosphate synthase small subunit [Planctomycetota bacterium]HRT93236.1 glutamine-hydrolyzing carbamoyl-phosphate synthase small subunit [Planctomycetota bacterium]